MKFTIEAMRGVVGYYRAFRVQPADCDECKYIALDYPVEDCPDGYEPMRDEAMYIAQCPEHNKPLYQWLHKADIDEAAQWLVNHGEKHPEFGFKRVMDEMRKDLGL